MKNKIDVTMKKTEKGVDFHVTESKPQHTPTPWHLKELTKDGYVVIGPLKKVGVSLVLKENVQDAAFIVRECGTCQLIAKAEGK